MRTVGPILTERPVPGCQPWTISREVAEQITPDEEIPDGMDIDDYFAMGGGAAAGGEAGQASQHAAEASTPVVRRGLKPRARPMSAVDMHLALGVLDDIIAPTRGAKPEYVNVDGVIAAQQQQQQPAVMTGSRGHFQR